MAFKLILISLLVAVVNSGLISQQSVSNEITDHQHPVFQTLSADDNNYSDEQEEITDFLENIFRSDDADRSRDKDSHDSDIGDNDSKPTDFLENIFSDDAGGSSRGIDLNGGVSNHDGGSSKVEDFLDTVIGGDYVESQVGGFASSERLGDSRENSRENDSRSAENDSKQRERDSKERDGDDNDSKQRENDSKEKDGGDNSSKPRERDSKEKDGNDKDSKEEGKGDKDDNKSTEDDSGTCQAYSVGVANHEFTLTTPDGCKIVVKLNGLKADQKTTFHEDIERNVRTVEISFDD